MRIMTLPGARKSFRAAKAKVAGQFDVTATHVGDTTWTGSDGKPVGVHYETSLGADGEAMAQNVLGRLDDLMAYCDRVFGVRGQGGNVIISVSNFDGNPTDGGGGAYHMDCSFPTGGDWYENYAAGNPDMVLGLVMAEVSESYMGLQAKGWNCGGSGGEALSRYLAEIVTGGPAGALSAFQSGQAYDGADWISKDQGTDGDYPSIGCGILYLWLLTSLDYTPDQIVQAGEPDGTLASNYAALTGTPTSAAFGWFKGQLPPNIMGDPPNIMGDNPWNAPVPSYP